MEGPVHRHSMLSLMLRQSVPSSVPHGWAGGLDGLEPSLLSSRSWIHVQQMCCLVCSSQAAANRCKTAQS